MGGGKGGEVDVISSPDSAASSSLNVLHTPPRSYSIVIVMPRTRNQEHSLEEEKRPEKSDQNEDVSEDTPAAPEPNVEQKEDDAAAKARERQARFKALQARAVSGSFTRHGDGARAPSISKYCIANATTEIRYRTQSEGNCRRNPTSLNRSELAEFSFSQACIRLPQPSQSRYRSSR